MRVAIVADASAEDITFPRGSTLWVIASPESDGRVKVLGHMPEGGTTTRLRFPSELDNLRVASFQPHEVPDEAVSWDPRERAPAWVPPLSYADPPAGGRP